MSTSPVSTGSGRGRLSIGGVLSRLRPDFPDVSISKIRFLESEGLVEPERTPSGYRKFSYADVERLHYILTEQRDHYYPLKVIKAHLDAMARGLEPPVAAGGSPRAPDSLDGHSAHEDGLDDRTTPAVEIRLSRDELLANADLSAAQLDELLTFGLVQQIPDSEYFDADALLTAKTVARLAGYGLEARHLRVFKSAADREVGLIDQIVGPRTRRRDEASRASAVALVNELGALSVRLHASLVRAGLRSIG